MKSSKIILISLTALIFLISEKAQGKFEKIKLFLKNYEVPKITELNRRLGIKFSSIEKGERSIEVKAFGKTFVVDLFVYFPKEDVELVYISKRSNHTGSYLDLRAPVYSGLVRNVKDSFAVGSFSKTNLFRGYIITDEIYCIEPNEEKSSNIAYKFKDVIAPGCSKKDKGDGLDCTKTKYFTPWIPDKSSTTLNYLTKYSLYDEYLKLFSVLRVHKISNEQDKNLNSDLKGSRNGEGGHDEDKKGYGTVTNKTSHRDDKPEKINDTDDDEKSHQDEKNKHGRKEKDDDEDQSDRDDVRINEIDNFGNQVTSKKGESNSRRSVNDLDIELVYGRNNNQTDHSDQNNKTLHSDNEKKDRSKHKRDQRKTDLHSDYDHGSEEDDRLDNQDYLKSPTSLKNPTENSTVVNITSNLYTTSPTEKNLDSIFKNISLFESARLNKESLYDSKEKLSEEQIKKKEKRRIKKPIIKALNKKPIDLECNLEVVIGPTMRQKFKNRGEDVIKDIIVQVTFVNKIFRKVLLQRKGIPSHLHFKIQEIVIYADDVDSPFKTVKELKRFLESHQEIRQLCFTIGLVNQDLTSGQLSEGSIPEGGGGACTKNGNALIVSHGNTDTPAPMALYFAALMRGITRGLGANDADEKCADGTLPNPMKILQDYLLAKEITPGTQPSLFTECNIKEMEKVLDKIECLTQVDDPLCGNGIVDKGEECDCGPDYMCGLLDPCCTPHHLAKKQKNPNGEKRPCQLVAGAKCGLSQPCCTECTPTKEKIRCTRGPGTCDVALCDGKSASCPTDSSASNGLICSEYNQSLPEPLLCKDQKCQQALCTGAGLKPCTCAPETDKECVHCCLKDGQCKAAGSDLQLLKTGDYPLANGANCTSGTCTDGECIFNSRRRKNFPVNGAIAKLTTLYSITCMMIDLVTLHFTRRYYCYL